jgi:hypothetical protein
MNLRGFISKAQSAARRLAGRFRRPAMIGTPPSQRRIWHDPAVHAGDFAERYAEDLDLIVADRIQKLGIPDHQNGRPDPDAGGRWRAFFPHKEMAAAWLAIRSMSMPACSTWA